MKKFIVETYYTCTFKTVHTLNDLNDKELSKIDRPKNRRWCWSNWCQTQQQKNQKSYGKVKKLKNKISSTIPESISNKLTNQKDIKSDQISNFKIKNNARFTIPDRRKGYIQKAQIGDHKVYLHTSMMMEKLGDFYRY